MFWKALAGTSPALALIGFACRGPAGLMMGILMAVITSAMAVLIIGRVGKRLDGALGGGSVEAGNATARIEKILDRARLGLSDKDFQEALRLVEEVLAERVDLPEALLLKAQILWEGFGETFEPKQYCRRIMALVADAEAPVHRRAAKLHRRLLRAAPVERPPLARRRLTR